jgi:hypothetical protein
MYLFPLEKSKDLTERPKMTNCSIDLNHKFEQGSDIMHFKLQTVEVVIFSKIIEKHDAFRGTYFQKNVVNYGIFYNLQQITESGYHILLKKTELVT